jgi:hypothetical protein
MPLLLLFTVAAAAVRCRLSFVAVAAERVLRMSLQAMELICDETCFGCTNDMCPAGLVRAHACLPIITAVTAFIASRWMPLS